MNFLEDQSPASPMAFDDRGSAGPPVLLLHGIMADRSALSDVAAELEADHRVVNVDLRGFGQSTGASSYETSDFVSDLHDLMTSLKLARATIVGWSMGGLIAQAFTLRHPEAVDRLVLVDSTPCLVQRPDWQAGISPEEAQGLGELLATDWEAGASAFANIVVNEQGQDEARERIRTLAVRADPKVNLTCFATVGGDDLRAQVGGIVTPVHVICGAEDRLCPAEASRYLAEQTSGTLAIIPGAGHAPFLTAMPEFLRLLRSALA